jgi:hypothetical protein
MKTVPCKLCGRPIVWATDEKGTRHPLDPKAPVYQAVEIDGVVTAEKIGQGSNVMGDEIRTMVTHFATCPNVGDLKRKEKP